MRTAYISHRDCHGHDTGEAHPECAGRLSAIEDRFLASGLFDVLRYFDAPEVTDSQLLRVHSPGHLDFINVMAPASGYARLDPDTVISPDSLLAARRAAGAAVLAVDLVMSGEMESAFCCVRPPGHHAERRQTMGFCIYNNIAVGVGPLQIPKIIDRPQIITRIGPNKIRVDEFHLIFSSIFFH